MSCEVDIKEYFFGETPPDQRRAVESHVETCAACRDELSRLQLTQAALGALRDEELPRRIAFVSDKVFEPRWYQRLWNSGPQLGFVAASMLAGAILVHGFVVRPVPAKTPIVATASQPPAVDQAAIEQAVAKAVAASEERQRARTVELLQAAEKRYQYDRKLTIDAFAAQVALIERKQANDYMARTGLGSGQ